MTGTLADPTTSTTREHWSRVLLTGGATPNPAWTTTPRPGTAVHTEPVPRDAVAAVAAGCGVEPGAVLLAAHAAVLAALSGDAEVVAGVPPRPGTTPLPVCLDTARSWSALVLAAAEALAGLHVSLSGSTLRLTYRLDLLDEGAAARIAGYHSTAVALAAADPGAPVRPSVLVEPAEREAWPR